MGQRILLFESDPAFSQEVRERFEALGATVDIATDGSQGIELATAHKPNLILLTIELPGMNGFLVCKKIKKHDGLQDVPLLILSSEATEDVFEQHKKLRTRAEDYIHKPIAFADLLERVKQFVQIETNGVSAEAADEIEISDLEDEEMILVADDSVPPVTREEPSDAELFAEEAVEALVADDEPSFVAAAPERTRDLRRNGEGAMGAQLKPIGMAAVENEAVTSVASAVSAANQEVARSQQELQHTQARGARLEAELAQMERRTKDAEQELQNAKQRALLAERSLSDASKKGGVSSRELLDMREQLNRKDRELLGLRDQVSSRDKQLIEASDKNLKFERELADQSDSFLELQHELEKAKEVVETLQADKEGSKKRADDLKARFDRAEQRNRELGEELAGIKATHQKESEILQRQFVDSRAAMEATHAQALEQHKRQHAAELEAARKAHADEIVELRDERAVAIAAAQVHAEEQRQAALAEQRAMLESQQQQRLAEQQQKHEGVVSQALAAHESELANTRRSLEERHTTEMRQTHDKYQQELSRAGRALAELENKAQLLDEQLEEAEHGRSDAFARLAKVTGERDQKAEHGEELQAQLDHLRLKRASQEQILERARKALAIGLTLLDEQKRNAGEELSENQNQS
jgi:DNA-binding response OmpR family regulator/chromosome segregation ATPase